MVKKIYKNIEVVRNELDTTVLLIELHEKLDKILTELKKKGGGSE